jgi:hypothetical protein
MLKANPHNRLSVDLLRRGIAHRLQEAAYGGLRPQVTRRLAAAAAAEGPTAGKPNVCDLKAGTTLVREWHGRTHTVEVLEVGFDYGGQRFDSLTRIAREITGAAWSGPRFFGVNSASTTFKARAGGCRE